MRRKRVNLLRGGGEALKIFPILPRERKCEVYIILSGRETHRVKVEGMATPSQSVRLNTNQMEGGRWAHE